MNWICEKCGKVMEFIPYATVFPETNVRVLYFCSARCIADFYKQEADKCPQKN